MNKNTSIYGEGLTLFPDQCRPLLNSQEFQDFGQCIALKFIELRLVWRLALRVLQKLEPCLILLIEQWLNLSDLLCRKLNPRVLHRELDGVESAARFDLVPVQFLKVRALFGSKRRGVRYFSE